MHSYKSINESFVYCWNVFLFFKGKWWGKPRIFGPTWTRTPSPPLPPHPPRPSTGLASTEVDRATSTSTSGEGGSTQIRPLPRYRDGWCQGMFHYVDVPWIVRPGEAKFLNSHSILKGPSKDVPWGDIVREGKEKGGKLHFPLSPPVSSHMMSSFISPLSLPARV